MKMSQKLRPGHGIPKSEMVGVTYLDFFCDYHFLPPPSTPIIVQEKVT